jgi:hypothetical protein
MNKPDVVLCDLLWATSSSSDHESASSHDTVRVKATRVFSVASADKGKDFVLRGCEYMIVATKRPSTLYSRWWRYFSKQTIRGKFPKGRLVLSDGLRLLRLFAFALVVASLISPCVASARREMLATMRERINDSSINNDDKK